MQDVVVIGGGVIGLSLAYELAGQGATVKVLEQSAFGREASWAGAGILPPGNPAHADTAIDRLRAESAVRWPALSRQLLEETGIDNGYRNCGGIELRLSGLPDQLQDEMAKWGLEGVEVAELTPEELSLWEPAVSADAVAAYRLPGLAQVRNPRHMQALLTACAARGVELIGAQQVVGFDRANGKVVAALTLDGAHRAGQFCVCGGAWSRRILSEVGVEVGIEPVRGQIVQLFTPRLPFTHVLEVGPRYLVPRPDGLILVGSTEERAGFEKRNTAGAVANLIDFAVEVVPALSQAKFERAWAGLRPGSKDGLPFLGSVPGTENLYVAAGHFRAGLQLSPGTAVLLRQIMLGQKTFIACDAFSCQRPQAAFTASAR